MKEFVEKLIERLEEEKKSYEAEHAWNYAKGLEYAVSIVNQLAEEFGGDINVGSKNQEPYSRIETVKSEHLECELPSDCYEQIKEVWVIDEFTEERKVFNQDSTKKNQGWIPVTERLPEIIGNTSDTVLVCGSNGFQYMAFWCDDLQWRFCECGTAKEPVLWTEIIAWQPLPEPYKECEVRQGLHKISQGTNTRIEHIRSMSVEELADKILESELSTTIDFCQNFEQCYENVSEDECRKCLIQYLNSPVEQKKTIPTKHFNERFNKVI